MATLHQQAQPWHAGERAMHQLLHVPSHGGNPTSRGLPGPYAYRVAVSPLVAFGALDGAGRPWTTVWGGEPQFARPVHPGILGVQSLVDLQNDPVVEALFGASRDGELVQGGEEGREGRLMSALAIDLETRDRVKLAGRMVAGAVAPRGREGEGEGEGGGRDVGEVQLAMAVEETLGNCPKYLNMKAITAHVPSPKLESDSLPLPEAAIDLIHKADLFFLSSTDGHTMDTNHRGGPAGLVRVVSNSATDGVTLIYPEFSGNRLYQTLGNLHVKPLVGLAIPDFTTGDVLYLTGTTTTLIGPAATAYLPHVKLAVRIDVTRALFVRTGLPFRGAPLEPSPYNPPVRKLATETAVAAGAAADQPLARATLLRREALTPDITRHTFRLHDVQPGRLPPWRAGQYVTLDFAGELDHGWSHMRDEDPLSLNDDFVRTFTVSSPPPAEGDDGAIQDGAEFALTLRRHGPATDLLRRHNLRATLELPVLGFGGAESFRMPAERPAPDAGGRDEEKQESIFVAGGVGITPLLAQAPGVLAAGRKLRVLWSLRGADLPLAVDNLGGVPGLGPRVKLFVTGKERGAQEGALVRVKELGAEVEMRRMGKEDVLGAGERGRRKFYVCTAPEMLQAVSEWLIGEEVVSESFNY